MGFGVGFRTHSSEFRVQGSDFKALCLDLNSELGTLNYLLSNGINTHLFSVFTKSFKFYKSIDL